MPITGCLQCRFEPFTYLNIYWNKDKRIAMTGHTSLIRDFQMSSLSVRELSVELPVPWKGKQFMHIKDCRPIASTHFVNMNRTSMHYYAMNSYFLRISHPKILSTSPTAVLNKLTIASRSLKHVSMHFQEKHGFISIVYVFAQTETEAQTSLPF